MDEEEVIRHPVSGSCERCGCALSHIACQQAGLWYCCGACAGSDRCGCGCKPEFARERNSDRAIPTRRMFAARQPDELRRPASYRDPQRAFPFANPQRGR